MSRIKTAVIPAGGYGTRFLPATKSVPKEMFPIGGKPVILHVVEEVVAAGIERVIFIVSHHKQAVESFFAPNKPMEDYYMHLQKTQEVSEMRRIDGLADYAFVYTQPPYGNGGALLAAQPFLGDEPFIVVWADELVVTPKGTPSRVQRCLDAYETHGVPLISTMKIHDPAVRCRYGMAELGGNHKNDSSIREIVRIVEKPETGKEPSPYASHGAYVLPPDIFAAFEHARLGVGGELWLTDLINVMKHSTGLYGVLMDDAVYLDCGNPSDYLLSQIRYACLTNPLYAKDIQSAISSVATFNS